MMWRPTMPALNRDPGLQLERTQLSWSRTFFVLALDGLFFLKVGMLKHSFLLCFAGLLLLVLLVLIKAYQYFFPRYFDMNKVKPIRHLYYLISAMVFTSSIIVITHLISL